MKLQKVVPPGDGEAGGMDDRRGEPTPVTPSYLVPKRLTATSKRDAAIRPGIAYVTGLLAAGQPVSEANLFEACQTRYRKKECLSILKELHRRYPRDTELLLQHGLWVLCPAQVAHP